MQLMNLEAKTIILIQLKVSLDYVFVWWNFKNNQFVQQFPTILNGIWICQSKEIQIFPLLPESLYFHKYPQLLDWLHFAHLKANLVTIELHYADKYINDLKQNSFDESNIPNLEI